MLHILCHIRKNLGSPFCDTAVQSLTRLWLCSLRFDTWFRSPSELKKTLYRGSYRGPKMEKYLMRWVLLTLQTHFSILSFVQRVCWNFPWLKVFVLCHVQQSNGNISKHLFSKCSCHRLNFFWKEVTFSLIVKVPLQPWKDRLWVYSVYVYMYIFLCVYFLKMC